MLSCADAVEQEVRVLVRGILGRKTVSDESHPAPHGVRAIYSRSTTSSVASDDKKSKPNE